MSSRREALLRAYCSLLVLIADAASTAQYRRRLRRQAPKEAELYNMMAHRILTQPFKRPKSQESLLKLIE